jgi:RimJ/RimL family protein N-acetyltransferase
MPVRSWTVQDRGRLESQLEGKERYNSVRVAEEDRRRVSIRGADERDLDALVSIWIACVRSRLAWTRETWPAPAAAARRLWWEQLHDERVWVAVADSGLTRVGCVTFRPGGSDPRLAYLAGPLVDPEWWGEGIGSALHSEALTVMAAKGYQRAELLVEAGDRRARAFLEHQGWRRLDEFEQRSAMTLLHYGLDLSGRLRRQAA